MDPTPEPSDEDIESSDDEEDGFGSKKKEEEDEDPAASNDDDDDVDDNDNDDNDDDDDDDDNDDDDDDDDDDYDDDVSLKTLEPHFRGKGDGRKSPERCVGNGSKQMCLAIVQSQNAPYSTLQICVTIILCK